MEDWKNQRVAEYPEGEQVSANAEFSPPQQASRRETNIQPRRSIRIKMMQQRGSTPLQPTLEPRRRPKRSSNPQPSTRQSGTKRKKISTDPLQPRIPPSRTRPNPLNRPPPRRSDRIATLQGRRKPAPCTPIPSIASSCVPRGRTTILPSPLPANEPSLQADPVIPQPPSWRCTARWVAMTTKPSHLMIRMD